MDGSSLRTGEMELSFFKSFCRGANLRALMQQNNVTGKISRLYQQYISPPARGTLFNDLNVVEVPTIVDVTADGPQEAGVLGDTTYQDLLALLRLESQQYCADDSSWPNSVPISREVQIFGKVRIKGVTYTTSQKAQCDSVILYHGALEDSEKMAGQIEQICFHSRPGPNGDLVQDYFLVVWPFRTLSPAEAKHDPYLKYPLLDVRLFHRELLTPIVIKATDVISHGAICPYKDSVLGGNLQVILSLCRVRSVHSAVHTGADYRLDTGLMIM